MASKQTGLVSCALPRVTIQFCTQCKWMLRAAYFAQELLSTFSLSLGEVALQPSTGGTFIVTIHTLSSPDGDDALSSSSSPTTTSKILWDRKTDGGFPETKELKRRVRDVIEPGRDLGHVDRHHKSPETATTTTAAAVTATATVATNQAPKVADSNQSPEAAAVPPPPADINPGVGNHAKQSDHLPAVTARHHPSSSSTTTTTADTSICEDCT
ncbi:hypothetical protein PT974_08310 [Cladobotryum mycophilum]|uniref:Selenoprotein W-like protein n=1 Tax=Cladobotryum mycophilum TaxID=491253 RepID=A0ABR0SDZ0_9HYPO